MQALKNLALMEFLPKEQAIDFVSDLLRLDEDETCNQCNDARGETRRLASQEALVYSSPIKGSPNLVRNLGIMFVIALAIGLVLIVSRLIKCLQNRYERARRLSQ